MAEAFEETPYGDSSIRAVELDPDAGHYPDLSRVLAYWREKCQGHFAPRRADIDPVDLRLSLSRITLVDVSSDPLDFRYRLCGTHIGSKHVRDLTGRRPLDLEPPDFGRLLHAHYSEAVRRREPLLHLILLDHEIEGRRYARLLLPFSEDRVAVTLLMTIDNRDHNAEGLRDFFEKRLGSRN
jgi:hypothetical protein